MKLRTFECILKNGNVRWKILIKEGISVRTSFHVSFFFYNVQNKIYIFIENLFGMNLTRLIDEHSYWFFLFKKVKRYKNRYILLWSHKYI